MCGIFGYVGQGDVVGILAEGIRRLEYRGYDSWGMAVSDGKELFVVRRPGRLDALEVRFHTEPATCWGGIAHTRWATHGEPSEQNAHPHLDMSGRIAIVHNGIIENHERLRERLRREGCVFRSETDSEVIAHLIGKFYDGTNLRTAFMDALRLLQGAYAVAMVCVDEPNTIYAGRDSSPLVVGRVEGSVVLASDAGAIVPFTRDVVYLADGEFAALRPDGMRVWNLHDLPVEKEVQRIAFDVGSVQRGGYDHFMLKEILEQPHTIEDAMRGRLFRGEGTARFGGLGLTENELREIRQIRILACGTSWHAGLIGRYLFEELAQIPTVVDYAAEFRYASRMLDPGTLVLAISQSGETADTLAAVREAMHLGARVLGICNVVGSTIARECGQGIYLHAGPEIGVASTKAFTSQLTVLALLALYLGRLRGMSLGYGLRFLDALEEIPQQVQEVLERADRVLEIAREVALRENVLYIGRLYEYPLALEGALKLKEISYVHAEGIPAAELKHGPIALIDRDMPVVVLAAQSAILAKMKSNVQEIRSRGGRIFAVVRDGCREFSKLAERSIPIPATLDPLVPILAAIPLQLLAYYVAVQRGCDVDRPRNLAKSVTVE